MTNLLISQLAQAANLSERLVTKYITMHHAKGWCGNWVGCLLADFVNSTDEEWEANYLHLTEWWRAYTDRSNERTVEQQYRSIVRHKLCLTGKLSPLYKKLIARSYWAKFENGELRQGRRRPSRIITK